MRPHLPQRAPDPPRRPHPRRAYRTIAFAVVTGALLAVSGLAGAGTLPATAEGDRLPSLAPMLDRVTPAVVNIATQGHVLVRENPLLSDPFFRRFFNVPDAPLERQFQSLGSGVIVDAKHGYILTNHHVIDKADQIAVTLRDGRKFEAKVVGTDPETDVAVLQIKAHGLTELKLANSDRLRVGDFVVAIGNPFGLGQTVTSGIVSALGRTGLGIRGYEDFIQTDASINPGNSGGALVNLRGELVGINTAIIGPSGGNVGIGFAIPSNMAGEIMHQLIRYGQVRRGLLGVASQDLTPELADAFGLSHTHGAVVVEVQQGSPAARAGIQAGDVVVAVNGQRVSSAAELRNALGMLRAGARVHIEVIRNGRTLTLQARLEARDQVLAGEELRSANERLAGATLANIPVSSPLHGRIEGVLVTAVASGSTAWRYGLRAGDVIIGVNRRRVRSVEEFRQAIAHAGRALALNIRRGNGSVFILMR